MAKKNTASPPLDLALQEQRFAEMKDFLPELLGVYRENAGPTLDKARHGLATGNLDEVSRGAHTLKGMSAAVCATPVQLVAEKLEKAAQNGDRESSLALFGELESLVQTTIEYLDSTLPPG